MKIILISRVMWDGITKNNSVMKVHDEFKKALGLPVDEMSPPLWVCDALPFGYNGNYVHSLVVDSNDCKKYLMPEYDYCPEDAPIGLNPIKK